jgi:hypothetical protein
MIKSPNTIMKVSTSPSSFVSFCFTFFEAVTR